MKCQELFEKRLIKTYTSTDKTRVAKVYKDPEWEENRVKFFINGEYQEGADYHTDDIDDAKQTANVWLNK